MNIYLILHTFRKWHQRTLKEDDLHILDTLKSSGTTTFILSTTHIFDVTDGTDKNKAINVVRFIDQLPNRWLRNATDLKREEMKNAINCFGKKITPINPFVSDYIETLELLPESY